MVSILHRNDLFLKMNNLYINNFNEKILKAKILEELYNENSWSIRFALFEIYWIYIFYNYLGITFKNYKFEHVHILSIRKYLN